MYGFPKTCPLTRDNCGQSCAWWEPRGGDSPCVLSNIARDLSSIDHQLSRGNVAELARAARRERG